MAMHLIDTGYQFGGKNPQAGLDCSGMVSYVFEKSVDLRLGGSAADLHRTMQEDSKRWAPIVKKTGFRVD